MLGAERDDEDDLRGEVSLLLWHSNMQNKKSAAGGSATLFDIDKVNP